MSIITRINYPLFTDDLRLFQEKQIHLVCHADTIAASLCFEYLFECGYGLEKSNLFVNQVNTKKEVGCLYPEFNFSLIPSVDFSSFGEADWLNYESYLFDVIVNANERLFKSDLILFVFENSNIPDFVLFENVINGFISKHNQHIKHLQKIQTNHN
jgi:hypothetical protein